ncbi:DNA primase [Pseudomonas phage PAP8]|nr:DNA primase [Pseudomonas phage PAP8]
MIIDDDNILDDDESGSSEFDLTQIEDAGMDPLMTAASKAADDAIARNETYRAQKAAKYAEAYAEPDLKKRARLLMLDQAFDLPVSRLVKGPFDDFITKYSSTSDSNYLAVYDTLFCKGDGTVPHPHFDEFRGRLVDHRGVAFNNKTLDPIDLMGALAAAALDDPSIKKTIETCCVWARRYRRNSLIETFEKKIPDWDGEERIETLLIDLFKPFDTELNRMVSKYFWLSLYCRINYPGISAPISLALIGGQDAGKSYFGLLICKELSGGRDLAPVQLDLSRHDQTPFLRNITGNSVIANVGEMSGFKKGDMERIKEFLVRSSDTFDQKFEPGETIKRQWITIMDGNGYDGLQRDDSGNRRFYPMFVAQLPDEDGKPNWVKPGDGNEPFKVDFTDFGRKFWQAMAECRAWIEERGVDGYLDMVSEANREVQKFSISEMENARGVVRDDTIDMYLINVLISCEFEEVKPGRNSKNPGWRADTVAILKWFDILARKKPISRHLTPHLKALGFVPNKNGLAGWCLPVDKVAPGWTNSMQTTLPPFNDALVYLLRKGDPDITAEEAMAKIRAVRAERAKILGEDF